MCFFSDCTSHCKDCNEDWKCETCEAGFRKEETKPIKCEGNGKKSEGNRKKCEGIEKNVKLIKKM